MSNELDTGFAHGMGVEPALRDWQTITLTEAEQLIDRYPQLGKLHKLSWHSPRPFSSAAIAVTDDGSVFIKRHHVSVRDVRGMLEEHHLIQHLHAHGAAVHPVWADVNGQTAHAIGQWTYELQPLAVGEDWYRDDVSWTPFHHVSHAFEAGRALASLHLAAEGYDAPARQPRPLISSFGIFASIDPAARLDRYIAQRPALARYLNGRSWQQDILLPLFPFHRQLYPLLSSLPPLWTHNDLHGSNMLWSGSGSDVRVTAILDFGLADRTNAMYDLATTIERNTIEWLRMDHPGDNGIVHYQQLDALLQGYHEVRPLSEAERKALPLMLPLVHAEYALSEIDYFEGIVHSQQNADLAYEEFLLGHAHWFHHQDGRDVLDYIHASLQKLPISH
ncbi:phosphotransferase enzyme family protein [Paenibacillus sp. WLX2291]|uniref:phosphotransferase enzyme family protein n=1 Tax=Paenibacillus sp. WLX2291 TaxID=3296934 RepID=UPI0039840935